MCANCSDVSDPIPALHGRTILLGVTGSIAAFKAADITSRLTEAGASVFPVMTASACRFITPLTLQTLARNPAMHDLWEEEEVGSLDISIWRIVRICCWWRLRPPIVLRSLRRALHRTCCRRFIWRPVLRSCLPRR